eukprot:COSAG02_NODE_3008_length_7563_cov_3.445606_5_plen_94_part_00
MQGHDRANTTLPGTQPDLVKAVLALNKPTVLVLVHGGAMSLGQLKDSAPAILDCFYGGEMAAQAMADVLFGKDVSEQQATPPNSSRRFGDVCD